MAALAHELQLTLAVLAGVLGLLFLRHRRDVPGGGFGWLGAASLLYLVNHVLTQPAVRSGLDPSLPWDIGVLLVGTASLACLVVGLESLARESRPLDVLRAASGFLILWPLCNLLVILARRLPPQDIQVVPALLLAYAAVRQWRCGRDAPGMGYGIVAVMLVLHPAAWLGLKLADVGRAQAQDLLSFPYVLAGLAILSVTLRRHQRRWQLLNADLESRLQARGEEVRQAQQQITAREVERSRLAERERLLAEVHDGLGTQLSTAALRLERTEVDREETARLLRECLVDLQLMVDTLQDTGDSLHNALVDFRERCRARLGGLGVSLQWQLELEGMPTLPPKVRLDLLRIVQEALNNALRHAAATQIRVGAQRVPDGALEITVEDDGRGLPAPVVAGRGLLDVQRRAQSMGAKLLITPSVPGQGTRMLLRLPLAVTPDR